MLLTLRAGFRYPIEPAPRTAVLVSWFRQNWFRSPSVVFPQGWGKEAAAFAPAAIAGTLEQLLGLAEGPGPPVLTHAVIVLARTSDTILSVTDRQRLWRVFRVPVFAQIIGDRGELVAAECEAHDGLHIETAGLTWAGCTIETAPCACGRATPRLAPAEPVERARSVAAYAR